MKRLHVLLGSSDHAAINRVEALVHDLCFERVMVECKRTAKLEDIAKLSLCGWMDLVIFSPDNLLTSGKAAFRNLMAESLRCVRQTRRERLVPFVAFGVAEENASAVLEAGAEVVLGPVWSSEQLRTELSRVMNLPPRTQKPVAMKWDFLRVLRGLSLAKAKA